MTTNKLKPFSKRSDKVRQLSVRTCVRLITVYVPVISLGLYMIVMRKQKSEIIITRDKATHIILSKATNMNF